MRYMEKLTFNPRFEIVKFEVIRKTSSSKSFTKSSCLREAIQVTQGMTVIRHNVRRVASPRRGD